MAGFRCCSFAGAGYSHDGISRNPSKHQVNSRLANERKRYKANVRLWSKKTKEVGILDSERRRARKVKQEQPGFKVR